MCLTNHLETSLRCMPSPERDQTSSSRHRPCPHLSGLLARAGVYQLSTPWSCLEDFGGWRTVQYNGEWGLLQIHCWAQVAILLLSVLSIPLHKQVHLPVQAEGNLEGRLPWQQ